jgi:poly(hydroxyalkanoate) granule-associated protein
MVKKLKSISEKKASGGASLLDGQLAASVKDSAQQIWLAGMGAFAKAQEEGGKVFEALVKEGTTLQKKTQGIAEDKISEVTGKMSAMAGSVTAKAGQNWDKLEAIFEQRTAKAMAKLGVPTAADVDALVKRVDALAAQVARLNKGSAPAATRVPAKKAAAKAAVKTPAKKAPAKRAARKQAAA